MADYCSLCGTKLSFFGGHSLVCANQDEIFCSSCHDKLYHMENLERGRYVLENGKPNNPEKIREFIVFHAERTLRKAKLEPPTRPCPGCGAQMELKLRDFRIGSYGDSLLGDRYDIDLYACPECGKVEMYTANFAAVKQALERKAQRQEAEKAAAEADLRAPEVPAEREYTSYRPGRKNEKPPWER